METDDILIKPKKEGIGLNIFLAVILLIFLAYFALVSTVIFCEVDGTSMQNTLMDHHNILLVKKPQKVSRGDIITVEVVEDSVVKLLVKRVIAIPGDRLVFKEYGVINGIENSGYADMYIKRSGETAYTKLEESYKLEEEMRLNKIKTQAKFFEQVYKCAPENTNESEFDSNYAIQMDEDEYFFMGDNRNNSSDSRKYGECSIKQITGKMIFKLKKDSFLESLLSLIYKKNSGGKMQWLGSLQIR